MPLEGSRDESSEAEVVDCAIVVSVEEVGTPDFVYNLNVESDHNYFANGILTHNCVDDALSAEGAASELIRNAANEWWDQTMSTRLNDPKTGSKVAIGQRFHENDLGGHILAQGGYIHLNLPAEFEMDNRCVTFFGDRTWCDWRQREGELLWPDRVGPKEVADLKVRLGPTGWSSQFQQRPSPAGGARFKKSYFQYWKDKGDFYELIRNGNSEYIHKSQPGMWRFSVMDPAGIDGNQNTKACYTVIHTWDVTPNADMILVDEYREQVDTPDAVNAAADTVRRLGSGYIVVERNGLGLGIVQNLMLKGIAVMGVSASQSKDARSETAEIRMAAHKVFFDANSIYLHDLEDELLRFPNGSFLDRPDCVSWACLHVQERHGAPTSETGDPSVYVPASGPTPMPTYGRYRRATANI